jgi:hypothetical protein
MLKSFLNACLTPGALISAFKMPGAIDPSRAHLSIQPKA